MIDDHTIKATARGIADELMPGSELSDREDLANKLITLVTQVVGVVGEAMEDAAHVSNGSPTVVTARASVGYELRHLAQGIQRGTERILP